MAFIQASAKLDGVGGLGYAGFNDPRAFNTAYTEKEWDEDEQDYVYIQEALFTNLNNDIALQVDGPSLVGRRAYGSGPAQRISLSGDFQYGLDGSLQINWGGLNTVTGSVASLLARVTVLEASDATRAAQIATLQGQVAALQATVVSLQAQIDLIRQTAKLNPSGSATLVAAGSLVATTRWTARIEPLTLLGTGALAVNEIKASFIGIAPFFVNGGLVAFYQPPIWMGSATFAGGSAMTVRAGLSWAGEGTLAPFAGLVVSLRAIFRPVTMFQGLSGLSATTTQRGFLAPITLSGAGSLNSLAGFQLQITPAAMTGVGGMTAIMPGPQVYAAPTSFAGGSALAASARFSIGVFATLAPNSTLTASTRFVFGGFATLAPSSALTANTVMVSTLTARIDTAGSLSADAGPPGRLFLADGASYLLLADGVSHLQIMGQ